MEKVTDKFMNFWVNLTCPKEYDRLILYISQTPVHSHFSLSDIKHPLIWMRRAIGGISGITIGFLATNSQLAEIRPLVLTTVTAVSVAILGANYLADQLIERSIHPN